MGYAGGTRDRPAYHEIGDHMEAVEVLYDPSVVGYDDLLAAFWSSHPATLAAGPSRVRSAVLYDGDAQREPALRSRRAVARAAGEPATTAVAALGVFWPAEAPHQKAHLQRLAPALVDELALAHGGREAFLASRAAARLNAWLGGFGGDAALAAAAAELGLEPLELRRRLRR